MNNSTRLEDLSTSLARPLLTQQQQQCDTDTATTKERERENKNGNRIEPTTTATAKATLHVLCCGNRSCENWPPLRLSLSLSLLHTPLSSFVAWLVPCGTTTPSPCWVGAALDQVCCWPLSLSLWVPRARAANCPGVFCKEEGQLLLRRERRRTWPWLSIHRWPISVYHREREGSSPLRELCLLRHVYSSVQVLGESSSRLPLAVRAYICCNFMGLICILA